MKHQQEVIEKIRRGDTELVWEEVFPDWIRARKQFIVWDCFKGSWAWLTTEAFDNEHNIEGEIKKDFSTREKAMADCQQWYNNFLLDQAKKLDQQS